MKLELYKRRQLPQCEPIEGLKRGEIRATHPNEPESDYTEINVTFSPPSAGSSDPDGDAAVDGPVGENKQPKKSRRPMCARCRNHGFKMPVKGHKIGKGCRFKLCKCRDCKLIKEKQVVMAKQVALRRDQEHDEKAAKEANRLRAEGKAVPPELEIARLRFEGKEVPLELEMALMDQTSMFDSETMVQESPPLPRRPEVPPQFRGNGRRRPLKPQPRKFTCSKLPHIFF